MFRGTYDGFHTYLMLLFDNYYLLINNHIFKLFTHKSNIYF